MEGYHLKSLVIIIAFMVICIQLTNAYDDLPCEAHAVANRSVICRCTAQYCDTVIREVPAEGEIITYTSSDSGLRFYKESSRFEDSESFDNSLVYNLDPEIKYQTINGFGGAITDSTGLNWQNLTDPALKQNLINSYCSDKGIEYSMLRVPIGGSDFSPKFYAYNEYPKGDKKLSNFTLRPEDYTYKLPFIKACMEVAREDIHMVGTCWSPPTWMKVLHNYTGVNYLRKEYYWTYAEYHRKFVDAYMKEGVPIWGVTTTNEPLTSIANIGPINSLGWTTSSMANWIADYFGPVMKKHHPDVKLLGVDDQRSAIPIWLNLVALRRPEVLNYLDGIAVHFYFDQFITADTIPLTLKQYPQLFALATEASFGAIADIKVDWGSWERAASYAKDIIEDLNVDMIGWLDWNMVLNSQGGPVLNQNYCDAPIIVKPEEGAFYKQPMFYSMGHFAKFLSRGSRRIKLETSAKCDNVYSVAALTPNNSIVVVFNNMETFEVAVTLNLRGKYAQIKLPPSSFVTAEFNNE
ncbi:lysosomal acid glucosylceramidase [Manduca sexta]|uniref:lysosomal acid glucosylceramidase n=1 Tax=Manduca sexta TaxID=7130 RepID=UPI00188E6594|nr:lysosomal acid glucosylceramidase [Manduca sexta]